jgi:O-antigen/teichoic acid export membrane protein
MTAHGGRTPSDRDPYPPPSDMGQAPSAKLPLDAGPRPLGHAVARGSAWMILNTVATKGLSLLAQLALAAILSEHDFGVYAIAISVSMFATILRDGGVRQVLIQRSAQYQTLLGPVFWMAMCLNLLTAGLLAAAAPLAARAYGEPIIAPMLWMIAASIPLGTPGATLGARLNIDLRFRAIAAVQAASSLVRYTGSVGLALAGAGPLSFVLPLPVVALVEWGLSWWFNRERLWSRPPRPSMWPGFLSAGACVLLATFAVGIINMGNYMAVGLVVPQVVVGVYFFAYQIVMQVGVLIGANMNQVLFPALVKITADPERLRMALRRSIRQLMLLSAPLGMALVPAFPHLERLIWGGRWQAADLPVQVIAIFYPLVVILAVAHAALQAWGHFRRLALLSLLQAAGMIASGLVAAWLNGSAAVIALASSAYIAISTLLLLAAALRGAGLGLRAVLASALPAWTLGLVASAAALAASTGLDAAAPLSPERVRALLHLVISGGVFAATFLTLARSIMPRHLREALLVVPDQFRPLAGRLLGVAEPPP